MAEYIERETAIKAIANDLPEQVRYSREDDADCIRYMDAADVAPVVRCKECFARDCWYKDDCGCDICFVSGMYVREEDDFCSYGEPKDVHTFLGQKYFPRK